MGGIRRVGEMPFKAVWREVPFKAISYIYCDYYSQGEDMYVCILLLYYYCVDGSEVEAMRS